MFEVVYQNYLYNLVEYLSSLLGLNLDPEGLKYRYF